MMKISPEELEADGFRRAGKVIPDPVTHLRVDVTWPGTGWTVYLMVVDGELKKAGTTGRQASTLAQRMANSFACIRQILEGRPQGVPVAGWWSRPFDPFKTHVPEVIRAGKTIELWAQCFPSFEAMNAK